MKVNSFTLAKKKKQKIPCTKLLRMQTTPMTLLLVNTPAQTKSLLHRPLYEHRQKQYMSISSTTHDINKQLTKAWTAIDRLSVIWKSELSDKIKFSFFQAVVVSILLYGCTTWMLTKRLEKKLDGNYTRILWAILNNSWRQHSTKQQLYSHIPPITKTIQIRWTRHMGHYWRSKDKLISNVLLWTLSHGWAKIGWPARTYLQQLCADTRCSLEDLLGVMGNRQVAREGRRNLC